MLTDTAIINAFLDTAGDMRAMREQLSLSAAEVLEALQRPAVQEYTEALAIELARTREVREALVLTKLAGELRPSLEAATDPSLRCRIVNTLIRTAKVSPTRRHNGAPRDPAPRRAATRPADPTNNIKPNTIKPNPIKPNQIAPINIEQSQIEQTQIEPTQIEPNLPELTQLKPVPTRPPFMNRAARRQAQSQARAQLQSHALPTAHSK